MSAIVIHEIFRLFVNTLTSDVKYSRRNMQYFWKQLQTCLSQKKRVFLIFYCISEMCMKFTTFWKTRRVSQFNYCRYYFIRKRCLVNRLKGLASADHSVINVLMGRKHCWCQHGTTIFLFLHEFEMNWVWKCLPKSHLKSSDCLLTHWLPMSSIPVAICRFSNNNFKRLYLKKERLFKIFYCFSEICMKLRTFWKKRRVS